MLADGTELKGSFLTLGEKLEDARQRRACTARCYDLFGDRPAPRSAGLSCNRVKPSRAGVTRPAQPAP